MRRAHGAEGTFVGLQVARALGGGLLPARYPLNDRVLDSALGLVGLTAFVASRAAGRVRGPVLHLPHHVSLPQPLPSRAQARRALGLPDDALVVTAPGLATASKRLASLLGAAGRLRGKASRAAAGGGRRPGGRPSAGGVGARGRPRRRAARHRPPGPLRLRPSPRRRRRRGHPALPEPRRDVRRPRPGARRGPPGPGDRGHARPPTSSPRAA